MSQTTMRILLSFLAVAAVAHAFSPVAPRTGTTTTSSLLATASRRQVVFGGAIATTATLLTTPFLALAGDETTLPNGVTYTIEKKGDGPQPTIGELAAIRFKATCGDNVIDDIFETPEPYYTRIGSGGMLKGVEGALPYMRVGDRWTLTIPANLAFGSKGRPASAGKPRIPSDATIVFQVEMVGLPGKEPELIEIIGD